MLTKSWENKKSTNNIFSKKERNKIVNMTPEQRQIEQFKEQLAESKEQSKNNELAYKIMNGEDLTLEEEEYLAKNNPGQLSAYRRVKAERHAYEEKLRKCKTKDEVQRLKTNTMNSYLAELKATRGEAKLAKAMELLGKVRNIGKAELNFIKSGGYANLPTEADEEQERAKERNRENEEELNVVKESANSDDEYEEENVSIEDDEIEDDSNSADTKENKDVIYDERKKEDSLLEEIEIICSRYIPNWDGKNASDFLTNHNNSKHGRTGAKIDILL